MKFLSKKDIQKAIDRAMFVGKGHYQRNYLIIRILAKTGVRVSELVQITPNDVIHDEAQVIIRGKGNKIRNIDIPHSLGMHFGLYQKKNKIKKNKPFIPLTIQQIRNITIMIADTNPHSFRHSYAIHLLRKTKNIRYVQVQLGHSTLRTTEIYLKYMEFEKEKEQLEGLYE